MTKVDRSGSGSRSRDRGLPHPNHELPRRCTTAERGSLSTKKNTSGTNCLLPIVDPHLKSISEVFYAHHIRYLANLIHGLSQKAEKRWLTSIKCSADNSACCSGTQ